MTLSSLLGKNFESKTKKIFKVMMNAFGAGGLSSSSTSGYQD